MEIKIGTIVRSTAGHDKGIYYLVTKTDKGYCYVVDGKERKLCKPKRKNQRHLALTSKTIDIATVATDRKIRQTLWEYNYGGSQDPD